MTPLCEIAKKFGTDKGGKHLIAGETCHEYTTIYDQLLGARRNEIKRVLEIGVNYGCSLRMWEEYFPNAEIIGLDCNAGCLFNTGRIRCFAADQNSEESLFNALMHAGNGKAVGEYDLIVDDGSHITSHQQVSANYLLQYLAPKGLYVIEDIDFDCQPETVTDGIHFNAPIVKEIYQCPPAIGKAHCWDACPKCHGAEPERLVVYRNG